jgi:hypothetical protein
MASVVITSFFTIGGVPATDIETVSGGTYPVVRIWELIDGTPSGDSFVGEFTMIPMEDGANDDGFYKYEFTDAPDGYDPEKTYTFRADGGPSLPSNGRYQVARLDPSDSLDAAAVGNAVWDVQKADHLVAGSTGEALSQIKADTTSIAQNLYLDADSVQNMMEVLLKLEAGRTKIDPTAKTLTVYDEDCTSILRVFELFDSTGTPSVTDVCERVPVTKGAGDTTTVTDTCP